MKRLLISYFSFILACVVVITAFITATSYIQLAVAILLYPVLVFFAYKILPVKNKAALSIAVNDSVQKIEQASFPNTSMTKKDSDDKKDGNSIGISDIDKRVFLKLIGGAGVFLFLMSIFNKKTEGIFYKNLPGSVSGKVSLQDTTGKTIDPSQNQPMDGYRISEFDDGIMSYYGFTNKDGAWIVMKVDNGSGSFRYSKGAADFPTNWTNRASLSYDYFNNIF